MQSALFTLLAAALPLAGCFAATTDQLRQRAAFDLDCSAPIAVVVIDKRTRGVRGCGKKATYVEHCRPCHNGYQGCDCTWVMNTAAR